MEVEVSVTNGTATATARYIVENDILVLERSSFCSPTRFPGDWIVKDFDNCTYKGAKNKAARETKGSYYGNIFSVTVL